MGANNFSHIVTFLNCVKDLNEPEDILKVIKIVCFGILEQIGNLSALDESLEEFGSGDTQSVCHRYFVKFWDGLGGAAVPLGEGTCL